MVFADDGSLFAAGYAYRSVPGDECYCFAVARFNADGAWDRSFGGDGQVMAFTTTASSASGIAIQTDGRIVAVGSVQKGSDAAWALARFHPDGLRDQSFGNHGRVTTRFRHNSFPGARVLAIDAQGRIVVAGSVGDDNPPSSVGRFALARYVG